MSQYGYMPPPGPYIPPNQGAPAHQQAAQQPAPYQSNATSPGTAGYTQKTGGTFGQMMNQRLEQAVTTGKPMLNKLGKSISSKLGNKPTTGTPQHLQSYQNYQGHHGQQSHGQAYQQPPAQTLSPQPQQQQQWGQAQQQTSPVTSPYPSAHHSPYPQSSYATPTPGSSGQPNYFPQQTLPAPVSQAYAPQSPVATSSQHGQGGSTLEQAQAHGQLGYSQAGQGLYQPVLQQEPQPQGSFLGQHTGIVASSQDKPGIPNHGADISPSSSAQSAQWQWGSPSPAKQDPVGHTQHQRWNSTSPPSQYSQSHVQIPNLPASPSPTQHVNAAAHVPSNGNAQSQNSTTPVSQQSGTHPAPTEFIAELPADLGNLSLAEGKSGGPNASSQSSQHQDLRPSASQTGSPLSSFVIPRRSLSATTLPIADPWRFADPVTETPTREFYILADLLYDALDRKFEPRNTGLLEAPKIVGSWVKLTDDARRLFSYRGYSAFAKLWSLEDIPHLMVPCRPALTPIWNFNQLSHAQDVGVTDSVPTPTTIYAAYMPALNRAGWYKFFFLEVMHAPEDIGDLIPALCADTYKPGVLNHPDLNKRDKSEIPALQSRAAEIQAYAIARVCEETKAAMAVDPTPLHQ